MVVYALMIPWRWGEVVTEGMQRGYNAVTNGYSGYRKPPPGKIRRGLSLSRNPVYLYK